MKKLSLVSVILGLAFVLSGCNTVQGLGKDVEKLGDKIEKKAEDKKSY